VPLETVKSKVVAGEIATLWSKSGSIKGRAHFETHTTKVKSSSPECPVISQQPRAGRSTPVIMDAGRVVTLLA
jgi:hypothetical protein